MIQREENGISINGVHIDFNEARELFEFMEHEYDKENVQSIITDKYKKGELSTDVISEDLLESIANDYRHSIDNSDDWFYHAENAVQDNISEIEAAILDSDSNELKESFRNESQKNFEER